MDHKKTTLIVGGARNLGAYLSEKFAKDHNVLIVDLDLKAAKALANKIGKNVKYYKCDVAKEKEVIKVFSDIKKNKIKIDSLIYVAGHARGDNIIDQKRDDLLQSLDVNLVGYAMFAKHSAQNMIKNKIKGFIININSVVGKKGSKRQSAYAAAKWGALGLTKSMALDLAPYQIKVNSLILGHLLDSVMFKKLTPSKALALSIKEDQVRQFYIDKIPLQRGLSYEDVFNVAYFYTSNKANYITGQAINISGGEIMW